MNYLNNSNNNNNHALYLYSMTQLVYRNYFTLWSLKRIYRQQLCTETDKTYIYKNHDFFFRNECTIYVSKTMRLLP